MPRRARIHYISLRSSLVNLPISIYGPLLERQVRPQGLAVHLTVVSGRNAKAEAYVGWTGMASASSLAHFNFSSSEERGLETIEIDPQYGQGLGFEEGDIVEIGLLHDLRIANSVGTEPLTTDDWEIIEIHASHVESTLLSQVRVAKVGQEIDVWVLGRTRVRLRVVSLEPEVREGALLLATDTEVSIAPKLRKAQPASTKATLRGAHPNALSTATVSNGSDPAPSAASLESPKRAQRLRVLPSKFFDTALPLPSDSQLYAYVSPRTFSLLQPSHPVLNQGTSIVHYPCDFRRLAPPRDPNDASSGSPEPTEPTARVLKAGAPESEKKGDDTKSATPPILVGWVDGLSDRHVVFPLLAEGIVEWDLVRVTLSENAKPVHVESGDTSPIPAFEESTFLAGIDTILSDCVEHGVREFALQTFVNAVHGVSGILVTGRQGSGKTSIAKEVARKIQHDSRVNAYVHYVDASRYADQPVAKVKPMFQYWYKKAFWHRPSVLILDNLDKLVPAEVEHADSFRSRHLAELIRYLFSFNARPEAPDMRGILLIATAASSTSLHPLVTNAHIFRETVSVKPPDKNARKEILQKIVNQRLESSKDIQQDPQNAINFAAIATNTEGYSALDLQDLISRAMHQVAMRQTGLKGQQVEPVLTNEDFTAAQADYVPHALRDVKMQKSDVAWDDIGGLKEPKKILRETLEWPTKYAPIFAQSPLRLRSGLLLYGYPGCGKTLLASAVAKECGLNFISVKGPEILNKYIGASEKSVRDLFDRASAAKPCVLFFDEFDSIAPKRGHDSTGVTDRVVNQMLTQMDGAEGLEGVYVLAATSRPDLIDSALLRPGRLDKSVLCDMPSHEDRLDILRAVGRKVTLAPDLDFDEIAAATDGFSGADLQALVYNAQLEVIHSTISTTVDDNGSLKVEDDIPVDYVVFGGKGENKTQTRAEEMALRRRLQQIKASTQTAAKSTNSARTPLDKREISQDDLRRALKTAQASVSLAERRRLDRIYEGFVSARGGLPEPTEMGGVGHRATLA
ncbi:AAA-domain-containing protein [Pluteus cervinus]|uniref:AAA-domain-containing protein n=1 Tax=Pluteus cervinus TaxID=181527 RepID=A0ACD3BAG1_9AGAR|nr:AAA-domain-containing protein [Pluteus cervinus]